MSPARTNEERKVEMMLMMVVLIWASNFPIAKWGLRGLDPFLFNSIRYLVAGALLAGIYFSRSAWMPIAREDWPKVLALGFLASAMYQMAFIIGLNMTSAGNSAVLISTAPLWTVLLNRIMHKEEIRPLTWAGMIISLVGIAMIVMGSGKKLEFGSDALYGDIITIIAAILWGLNTNFQKPFLAKYSALQLTLVMILVGSVFLTVAAIPSALNADLSTVHWSYYLAAIASGALSIALANLFWSNGVKKIGPKRTANFANLVPVIAFGISFAVFRESILPIQIIGAAVTIGGVWLARR